MAINEKIAEAFDKQVTAELEASVIYLQLSYILDDLGLTGMSNWLKAQSDEEQTHAQKFASHLLDRDYVPQIQEIKAPKLDVKSAEQAFEAAYNHEKQVSAMIRELAELQIEVNDWDSRPLVDEFLNEQIEEEANVSEILDRIRLTGGEGSGLLRIDNELKGSHPAA